MFCDKKINWKSQLNPIIIWLLFFSILFTSHLFIWKLSHLSLYTSSRSFHIIFISFFPVWHIISILSTFLVLSRPFLFRLTTNYNCYNVMQYHRDMEESFQQISVVRHKTGGIILVTMTLISARQPKWWNILRPRLSHEKRRRQIFGLLMPQCVNKSIKDWEWSIPMVPKHMTKTSALRGRYKESVKCECVFGGTIRKIIP